MSKLALVMAGLLVIGLALSAAAGPPVQPRANGNCVWANRKVYWYMGHSMDSNFINTSYYESGPTDEAGKKYYTNLVHAGISIYDPTADTWASSRYDATGPLGWDMDGDGVCEWHLGVGSETWAKNQGTDPIVNQGFAYDDDGDGTEEVFAVGGYYRTAMEIWRYDPNDGARGSWTNKTSNPTDGPFYNGAIGLYGTKIYLYGGTYGQKFRSYDLTTGWWDMSLANGPVTTGRCATTVLDGKLYIIGGSTNDAGGYSTQIWTCDLTTEPPTWSASKVGDLLTGVKDAAAVSYNGQVYVLGGMTSAATEIADVQVFDPATGTTTLGGTLPFARVGIGAAVDPATGVLYTGGGGSGLVTGASTTWWGNGWFEKNVYPTWWKADLNDPSLTFTQIADDPSYFPYEDGVWP